VIIIPDSIMHFNTIRLGFGLLN